MPLLRYDRQGSGPTLLWLHGFTQTRSSAHQFRTILAGTNELLTPDLPGHGDAASITATLEETADLIASSLPRGPIAVGGYSYGARVALHIALRHPERVRRLIVLGASRGIRDTIERQARRERDEVLARRIEEIGTPEFLQEWLAQPMFERLPSDTLERASRSSDAAGLARSLRSSGTGTQQWLGGRLATIAAPTLALAGELDAKFTLEARAVAEGVAHGTFASVANAGHAAHLEQPTTCAHLIQSFLVSE